MIIVKSVGLYVEEGSSRCKGAVKEAVLHQVPRHHAL